MSVMYVKVEPSATRLGNWMFQYAAAKTADLDAEIVFVVPEGQSIDEVKKFSALWPDARYVREASADATVRCGYFQDAKYVDRNLVRKLYAEPLAALCNGTPVLSVDDIGDMVSIHVRRGDYMAFPHRHPFVGREYLREAVRRFPGREFLVFSDDIQWCKKFFKGESYHFSDGNSVLDDLYLMTQCKGGHICSNSTFSWWGAYLGEGRTVFPSMWYGPAVQDTDWRGLYFDGSEVIKNGYSFGLWLRAWMSMAKTSGGNVLRKLGLR